MVERNLAAGVAAPNLEDQVFKYIICEREVLPEINLEDALKAQKGLYRFKLKEDILAQGNNIEAIEKRKRAEEIGFVLDKHFSKDFPDRDILEILAEEIARGNHPRLTDYSTLYGDAS